MRHIEDEKRLAHDEDNSRLGHEVVEDTNETALTHVDSTDETALRQLQHNDSSSGEAQNQQTNETHNPSTQPTYQDDPNTDIHHGKSLSSKGLRFIDQLLPNDRDNITAQAIKHDVFETPAAMIDAFNDVQEMRQRGRRQFFENKDDAVVSAEQSNSADNATIADTNKDNSSEPLLLETQRQQLPDKEASSAAETSAETLIGSTLPDGETAAGRDNDAKDDNSKAANRAVNAINGSKDYYTTLGIDKNADESEIKNAYRDFAKKYHPDVNNGDKAAEARFKEANEAYRILGDPQKRQVYDRQRANNDVAAKQSSAVKTGSKADTAPITVPNAPKNDNPKKTAPTISRSRKKDRFMRRVLDRSYILSQGASNLMPDEQQDEDSGTKGIRTMISESAKLVKIFATAELKPSKLRHAEDEEILVHENTPEESRLEHETIEGESVLQLEDSSEATAPSSKLLLEDKEKSKTALVLANSAEGAAGVDSDTPADFGSSDTSAASSEKSKDDIKIDKNIDRYTAEAAKLEKKINKAEKKIPKKKVKKSKLVHNEQTGEKKRQISFSDEKVAQADAKWNQGQSKTLAANSGRYVTGHASAFVHGKVSESENLTGNTGLKAAHTGEKALVKTYQTASRVHRYAKNAPYRKLQHLKLKEAQNKGKLAYNQLLKDKPELRKKANTVTRLIQKRRIKREYAQAFRAAQGGGKMGALGKVGIAVGAGAAALSGDGKGLAKMGVKLGLQIAMKKMGAALVKAAAPILLKIGAFVLIIAAILLLFTMCASLIGTGTAYLLDAISYQADMDEITEYSVYMTQMEVELKEEIMEAATDLEGLHEFRFVLNTPSGETVVIFEGTLITPGVGHPYNTPPVYAPPSFDPTVLLPFLTDITHNPFEVMAYLTAVYGDFEGYDIKAILREVFETAFTLEIVAGYEIRSMMVEAWHYELQDLGGYQDMGGWQDLGGFVGNTWVSNWQLVSDWQWVSDWQNVRVPPFEELMNYNRYYREVKLTVNMTISQVIQDRMNADQQEHYDILMESLGLRQFVGSPFENNWLPNMTSPFGYRFHPISLTREKHTGIDIAMPQGTPILSGVPGIVTFAGDMGGYGNTVIIEYVDEESGVGVRLLYAHMHEINVSVGAVLEMGDVIGTVGTTGVSTGNHLHMEVSINEDGGAWRRLNPLLFVQPYVS